MGRPMADDDLPSDEEVGYGKPPRSKQWRKGVSGNPRGRPRKPRGGLPRTPEPTMHLTILEEGNRLVEIKQNGKSTEIPIITAVIRGLGVAAARGDRRAQLAYAEMYQAAEKQRLKDKLANIDAWITYKRHWEEKFAKYDRAGAPRPDPIPHPDDFYVDYATGDIVWNGPRDETEAIDWKRARREVEAIEKAQEDLYDERRAHPERTEEINAMISNHQATIDAIDQFYPPEDLRRGAGFRLDVWRSMRRWYDEDGRTRFD